MSRSFLVEETTLDVSGAKQHGRLVLLFPPGRYRPSVWEPTFAQAAISRLEAEGFDPEHDFIVLTGQQLTLVALVAAVVARYGKFRALAFNAHGSVRDYEQITMGVDYDDAKRPGSVCGHA